MKRHKYNNLFLFSLVVLVLILGFQNCSNSFQAVTQMPIQENNLASGRDTSPEGDASSEDESLPAIPVPDSTPVPIPVVTGDVPVINPVPDQTASRGTTYSYTPTLAQGGLVNWTKTYGPDEVSVHPITGQVSWSIPANQAGESFYVGVQATNAVTSGIDEEVWLVHVSVPKVVYIGANETYKTLSSAFSSESTAGTTFVVRNGTYSGVPNSIDRYANIINGTTTQYTSVISENPSQSILQNTSFSIAPNFTYSGGNISGCNNIPHHIAIKGFYFKHVAGNTTEGWIEGVTCRPHHIKFTHLGVESSGDTPINAYRSDNILIENCYVFGGGRYKIASYQSTNIVMRRNVARYDRSNNEMAEPKGTYSIYTTDGADVSNNIAVDGIKDFITWGQLAGEYTCPVTSGPTKVYFNRNLQLNSDLNYGNIDSQQNGFTPCEADIRDVVSWDVRPYASSYVMTRGLSHFNHVTMGKVVSDSGQFINGWPGGYARGMVNSVMHDFSGSGMFYGVNTTPISGWTSLTNQNITPTVTTKYGAATVNITGFSGSLNVVDSIIGSILNNNPIYSSSNAQGGLKYLVRIEKNSNLSGKGNDGGDLGANNVTFKGRSGTFYSEPGYNVETNIPSWPHPQERLIKEKMAAYSYTGTKYTGGDLARVANGTGTINGARGFAVAGQSLANYVWGYLGNLVPPFNVHSALSSTGSVIVIWDPPAPLTLAQIGGFTVYELVGNSEVLLGTIQGKSQMYFEVKNPTPGVHQYAVKAFRSADAVQSGYSYSTQIIIP